MCLARHGAKVGGTIFTALDASVRPVGGIYQSKATLVSGAEAFSQKTLSSWCTPGRCSGSVDGQPPCKLAKAVRNSTHG